MTSLESRFGDEPTCKICGSESGQRHRIEGEDGARSAWVCGECQHVELSPVDMLTLPNRRGAQLRGSRSRTGRHFGLATLGCEILGRGDLEVATWESGSAPDLAHIAKIPFVKSVTDVAIWDQDDAKDTVESTSERYFDLIIACEVLHYFDRPAIDLLSMLGRLDPNGLLVASTDLYDSTPPETLAFLKYSGHRCQWSPESLYRGAELAGVHVDFRLLEIGVKNRYRRKRAVLFSRSEEVMKDVREWFGDHPAVPSEALT